ncbi:saccharopine dehydrogenase NADP-binding domain-containing protein [soil metagenome]
MGRLPGVLDVLLFGATGHTGRLVAHALARRGARFAVAGRDRAGLEAIAGATGAADVHLAAVGDVPALAAAGRTARVLLSCVGPFAELGDTAVAAALEAGAHYVDSTGEAVFVARLVSERDRAARAAGVTLAPALAFDEVPADVAATLATQGMRQATVSLTYALPSQASAGTVLSALDILTAPGWWLRDGRWVPVHTGAGERWAPMPPPLGPCRSISASMAEARLAPLHLDVASVATYLTVGSARRAALKLGMPVLRRAMALPAARRAAQSALLRTVERPASGRAAKARWTVLAEARADGLRRNVVITGLDVYGLSAELLASGALAIARRDDPAVGVVAPTEAVGLTLLRDELMARGATIEVFEPA